jgi:CRP-like cAMP-binding protein
MLYHGIQPCNARLTILKALRFPIGTAQETETWWISFTVKCQRTIVYDSLIKEEYTKALAKAFGGPAGNTCAGKKRYLTLPVGVTLCEDTKIEMYRHTSANSESRKLMWFVVFHPAFYAGTDEIKFEKKKVDMLHKDSKCKKADADFILTLEISNTAPTTLMSADSCAENVLQVQQTIEGLFQKHGDLKVLPAGQMITSQGLKGKLMLITSGLAEAVVHEDVSQIGNLVSKRFHPVGSLVQNFGQRVPERVPVHSLLGPGHILGVTSFLAHLKCKDGMSGFLHSSTALPFRARTKISFLILEPKNCRSAAALKEEDDEKRFIGQKIDATVEEYSHRKCGAWMVKKRLNMLQTSWRCMKVDCKNRVIVNKEIKGLKLIKVRGPDGVTDAPVVPEEQMLDTSGEKKLLPFDDLGQIIQYSETSLQVTLKFISNQRPYQIFFQDVKGRDGFLSLLKRNLDNQVFQARSLPLFKYDNTIELEDIEIAGLKKTQELSSFYRGLAHKLVLQLDRTQTECIRFGLLKALTDTDALLLECSGSEQLRLEVVRTLNLPESQKIVLTCKCFITTEDMGIVGVRPKQMRLILMDDYLLMDSAIYGPKYSKPGSFLFYIDHFYAVFDDTTTNVERRSHSFSIRVLSSEKGWLEVWHITFAIADNCLQVRTQLEDFALRGEQMRKRHSENAYQDSDVHRLIHNCSTTHQLVEGEELVEARSTDSLFIIQEGEATQIGDKLVHRILRKGCSFGETNFVKGTQSSYFSVRARSPAIILEVQRVLLLNIVESDHSLGARFWFAVCKSLNLALIKEMASMFPGTWSAIERNEAGTRALGQEASPDLDRLQQQRELKALRSRRRPSISNALED